MTKIGDKIDSFCKKYKEERVTYGMSCYVESIWLNNGELESKLSTSGSFGAPYYLRGYKTRAEIKADLIRVFNTKT